MPQTLAASTNGRVGAVRYHRTLIVLSLASFWAFFAVVPARSEEQKIALIISNARYNGIPELAHCAVSAATVRDSMKDKGFEIVERTDLGRGEFDAAIGLLARRASASPAAVAALYYCGYAVEFNGRSFLLPISANLARDNDVLTQGIIAKSVIDSLTRNPENAGLVLFDVFSPPGVRVSAVTRLVEQIQPSQFAIVAAGNDGGGQGLTAASKAVRDQLTGNRLTLTGFINGLRDRLAKETSVSLYIVQARGKPSYLIGAPDPPAPQAPSPQALTIAVQTPPPPPPVAAVPPPVGPSPRLITMGDEEQMSDQDRRQVQVALATMGYYGGRIDGVFGPETKAAIRRYQFEIKADLTGRMTAEQATKLVNNVR